jgi:cell division protease FtsH
VEPEELAGALKRLADWAAEHAPPPEPEIRRRLREHLAADPRDLPIVSRALAEWDRPNFQVAIDAWCADRDHEVVGLPVMQGYRAGLSELVGGQEWLNRLQPGAVEHVTVPLGEHESISCVQSGFWLVREESGPLVVMLKSVDRGMEETLGLEVMAVERERGEAVVAELWALMREHNVYRGRILELGSRYFHEDEGAPLTVRTLPRISRDRIVLPPGVLERVERHRVRRRGARRAA